MGKVVPFSDITACDPFTGTLEELANRLVRLFDYPDSGAAFVAPQIKAISEQLRGPFRRYWMTLEYDGSVAAEGYSLGELIERLNFHPIAAFLALDALVQDPADAKTRIRKILAGSHAVPALRRRPLVEYHVNYRDEN